MARLTVQEVYERQGFLVIACMTPGHALGDVIPEAGAQGPGETVVMTPGPMIITAPATRDEFMAQDKLLCDLDSARAPGGWWVEFWKVAAE
jgi:hypothetical protein